MCSNKVDSFEDNYRRDSFDDRICDDLSEVILQFLSLEDKFRFECVSKQFQRTVFVKQNKLVIDRILAFREVQKYVLNYVNYIESSHLTMETVLKKLPNIRCIEQKAFQQIPLKDRDMYLIIKYCRYLISIHCDFKQISNDREFAQKFSQIRSFSGDINSFDLMGSSSINLKRLYCLSPYYSCSLRFFHLSILKVKNLTHFAIELNETIGDDLISFQTFIENNLSITHLNLEVVLRDEDLSRFLFLQISRLNNLVELKIRSRYIVADKWLINGIKQIANKCHKLKTLTLRLVFFKEVNETKQILKEVEKFKQLKRLTLEMFGIGSEILKEIEVFFSDWVKCLPKSLTHLKISFPKMHVIDDRLLNDFDKYLPKLQSLKISDKMGTTDETVNILSRLSRLQLLDLMVNDMIIADNIQTNIVKNCKQIKSIKIGV